MGVLFSPLCDLHQKSILGRIVKLRTRLHKAGGIAEGVRNGEVNQVLAPSLTDET